MNEIDTHPVGVAESTHTLRLGKDNLAMSVEQIQAALAEALEKGNSEFTINIKYDKKTGTFDTIPPELKPYKIMGPDYKIAYSTVPAGYTGGLVYIQQYPDRTFVAHAFAKQHEDSNQPRWNQ